MKTTVIVQSPSHKCSIDFKVRGRLNKPRVVKEVNGQPSVRVGNVWHPVTFSGQAPGQARLTLAREVKVTGLVKI